MILFPNWADLELAPRNIRPHAQLLKIMAHNSKRAAITLLDDEENNDEVIVAEIVVCALLSFSEHGFRFHVPTVFSLIKTSTYLRFKEL